MTAPADPALDALQRYLDAAEALPSTPESDALIAAIRREIPALLAARHGSVRQREAAIRTSFARVWPLTSPEIRGHVRRLSVGERWARLLPEEVPCG